MSSSVLPPHVRLERAPAHHPCPACAGARAERFYAVDGIPIHSCVLLDDPHTARGFPRGDLELAACPDCGFLFNPRFDASRIDYREDYEETQGCSPTFNAWLDEVAGKLLTRGVAPGGTVVEPGCGRGDFLALLCRRGDLAGVGVDPSATAGRVELSAGRGLTFLREPYGPEHARLAADLIVCRHTLEHLPAVSEFLRLVRSALAERPGALVFCEVPDVARQLAEGAFWDIYYEHCSYFSRGSLARLFARTGFEVLEVELTYGGQYLQLSARPAAQATPLPSELDDRAALARAVADFERSCRASIAFWHAFLEEAAERGERVVLWGSGSKGTGFLTTLGAGPERVAAVVDINPAKHGRYMAGTGQRILAPGDLARLAPEHVIVMNPIYRDEIAAALARLGLNPRVVCVGSQAGLPGGPLPD